MRCYLKDAEKRITFCISCDHLYCQIASENRMCVLSCGGSAVGRNALSLNQSAVLISKLSCKAEANSVS